MVFFKKPRRRYCYGRIKDFIFQLYKGNSKRKITSEVQFWWKSVFWIFANKIHILTSKVHILIQIQLAHQVPCLMITMFENHRKSLIQHCRRTFTFWLSKSSLQTPKLVNLGSFSNPKSCGQTVFWSFSNTCKEFEDSCNNFAQRCFICSSFTMRCVLDKSAMVRALWIRNFWLNLYFEKSFFCISSVIVVEVCRRARSKPCIINTCLNSVKGQYVEKKLQFYVKILVMERNLVSTLYLFIHEINCSF